jgi:hypothetical protein
VRLRSVVALALLSGLLAAPVAARAPAAARAVDCSAASAYPGDTAPKPAIAGWMARGAAARGIPGELPVMAALVESDLVNLKTGSGDARGYFQMRQSVWSATYPGFPDDPELQLDWFLDRAAAVRTPPYPVEAAWGEWAADVERPAQQYRYRYQLRLADARSLIGQPCDGTDTVAPQTDVAAALRQQVLQGHRLQVTVACLSEPCTAAVRARVLLGGRPEVAAPVRTVATGQPATFKLRLPSPARQLVARAIEQHVRAEVRFVITTTDAAGNAAVTRRTVRVTG